MAEIKINIETVKKAIEIAGGVSTLASMIGVSYQTVLNWKNGRTTISLDNCIKIELATQGRIKREEVMSYPEEKKEEKLKLEISKNLLEMGMDKKMITKATGLSLEELENIKS